MGSPLVKFEKLEKIYLSNEYYLFNTIGYSKMNTLRKKIFRRKEQRVLIHKLCFLKVCCKL